MATNNSINNETTNNYTVTDGNFLMDNTNTGGTTGVIEFGGLPFISNYGTDNLFIGPSAGNTSLTGNNNIGIGSLSSSALTAGTNNVGIGSNSLAANLTGNNNVAVGTGSQPVTMGSNNSSVGAFCLVSNTTGTDNCAVGLIALFSNISGSNNIGIGSGALRSNTTQNDNIAIGSDALFNNSAVGETIAIGSGALNNLTSGTNNTAIGHVSQFFNTSGTDNISVGTSSLYSNAGSFNTAIGSNVLYSNNTGTGNTALGYAALQTNISGVDNVALGSGSLNALASGSNNTVVGYQAGINYNSSESSNICIGSIGYAGENNVIRIGQEGSGAGQQDSCYIAGIFGTSPTISPYAPSVVICDANNNLTVTPPVSYGYVLTDNGFNVPPTFQAVPPGSVTITGDMGSISGSSLVIYTDQAANNSGSTVLFSNTGTTSVLNLSDPAGNTMLGSNAGKIGFTGSNNTGVGYTALFSLNSGSGNVAVGAAAGTNYSGGESNNICLGDSVIGSIGESNAIHIGDNGSFTTCYVGGITGVTLSSPDFVVIDPTSGQLGVASASPTGITTIDGDTGSITGSTVTIYANNAINNCGATVQFVNSGTVSYLDVTDGNRNTMIGYTAGMLTESGTDNTALGNAALNSLSTGNYNTAIGSGALTIQNTGTYNVALGYNAMSATSSGDYNTALGSYTLTDCTGSFNLASGYGALGSLSSGTNNVCEGWQSGVAITIGVSNTALGYFSLGNLSIGSGNIAMGDNAGGGYTGGESYNISLGYATLGTAAESGVIRIGNSSYINSCFIQGINGVNVGLNNSVVINASGQLGIPVSSIRYKENISDIPDFNITNLRPVQFNYKSDETKTPCYGLIAEEVLETIPELVQFKDGLPDSVHYNYLPIILLKELQKKEEWIMRLEQRIEKLEKGIK